MRRTNKSPKSKRAHVCPQCDKNRLLKPLNEMPSLEKREYKTRTDEQIELFIDICDACKARNWRKYFEPTKADIKRILKTMQENTDLEDQSLEDLL